MVRFLNKFSRKSEKNDIRKNEYLEQLFLSFMQSASSLSEDAFTNKKNNRFKSLCMKLFSLRCAKKHLGNSGFYQVGSARRRLTLSPLMRNSQMRRSRARPEQLTWILG